MTRTIEHQQDSFKGKWESSDATKHCLKCHVQLNWLHPKTLLRKVRYKSTKFRELPEIKRSKCDSSKSNINHDGGNLVKIDTWTSLLRNVHCAMNKVIAKQIRRQINICILTVLVSDLYV